ncbi:MAG: hypothetical protein JXB00_14315 [Bacteroidales bacterium]|nr:hypothetical protein [Bacteroidales bacterium]
MKKLFLFMMMVSVLASVYAQEDETIEIKTRNDDDMMTLLGSSNALGGYGGLSILYSEINGKDGFCFGARGAAIMGHSFALGFGGSGFVTDIFYDDALATDVSIAGGYGGLFFEPIILPKFPVHVTIPVLVGVGGVAYSSVNDTWEEDWFVEDSEAFFVVEPGVELELNVTKFFRFSFGAYYRYTSNIQLQNSPKDMLHGFSYGVNFKFGKF